MSNDRHIGELSGKAPRDFFRGLENTQATELSIRSVSDFSFDKRKDALPFDGKASTDAVISRDGNNIAFAANLQEEATRFYVFNTTDDWITMEKQEFTSDYPGFDVIERYVFFNRDGSYLFVVGGEVDIRFGVIYESSKITITPYRKLVGSNGIVSWDQEATKTFKGSSINVTDNKDKTMSPDIDDNPTGDKFYAEEILSASYGSEGDEDYITIQVLYGNRDRLGGSRRGGGFISTKISYDNSGKASIDSAITSEYFIYDAGTTFLLVDREPTGRFFARNIPSTNIYINGLNPFPDNDANVLGSGVINLEKNGTAPYPIINDGKYTVSNLLDYTCQTTDAGDVMSNKASNTNLIYSLEGPPEDSMLARLIRYDYSTADRVIIPLLIDGLNYQYMVDVFESSFGTFENFRNRASRLFVYDNDKCVGIVFGNTLVLLKANDGQPIGESNYDIELYQLPRTSLGNFSLRNAHVRNDGVLVFISNEESSQRFESRLLVPYETKILDTGYISIEPTYENDDNQTANYQPQKRVGAKYSQVITIQLPTT